MSSLALTMRDASTMLRRNIKHQMRYPTVIYQVMVPIVLLVLFVYVFGETMGAGLPGASAGDGGRDDYVDFLVPGILLLHVLGAATNAAIAVASDMTTGIVARFRTMDIARTSVLTGHVLGTLAQTMLALPVVIGVALAVGFRPTANVLEWAAVAGVIALVTLAVIWLSVALGLRSKSVETASNAPMPLMLLPFLGSGFVPTETLPVGLRWFAEHQPFTPIMDLLRALLFGRPVGDDGWLTVAWCVGIGLFGYLWSKRLYERDPQA